MNPSAQRKASLDAPASTPPVDAGAKNGGESGGGGGGCGGDVEIVRTPRSNVGVGLSFAMRPQGGFVVSSLGMHACAFESYVFRLSSVGVE